MRQLFNRLTLPACRQMMLVFFLSTIVLVFGCLAQETVDGNSEDRLEYHLDQLKNDPAPLQLSRAPMSNPSIQAYLQYYGLRFNDTRHYFGKFKSNGRNLVAQVFYPDKPIATAFILHGYCDHTGSLKHLIGRLLDMKLAVAAFDLPGHGLSDGPGGSINDFNEYATALADYILYCRGHLPATTFFIGHSTGCAAEIERIYRSPEFKFSKTIFLAPLVRSAFWTITKANYYLAKPFVEAVPRIFRDSSSDPEFIAFLKKDPLQCHDIPLKWVEALLVWNERLQDYQPGLHAILVIQGTGDSVVDWKYNIPFLSGKLGAVRVNWIEDARHQLVNESPAFRSIVFKHMKDYLINK